MFPNNTKSMCSYNIRTIVLVFVVLWTFMYTEVIADFSPENDDHIRDEILSHPNWKLLDRGDNCGHSISDRIIGGKNASLGQYPWLARLGYIVDADSEGGVDLYECGGAIISERYILSAAHCSSEALDIKLIEIRLGEHNVQDTKDCVDGICAPPVQDIAVEEYYCHPEYTKTTYHHDICLIRLAKPIEFNDFVAPICLPFYDRFMNSTFDGSIMDVAGWGLVDLKAARASDVLQTLKVPVVSNNFCALIFSGLVPITSKQICAGGEIGKDSCSGDSGGPLMKAFAVNGPPRYFIIGIVSFGPQECAKSEKPGVYTLVSEYWKWILDNVHA